MPTLSGVISAASRRINTFIGYCCGAGIVVCAAVIVHQVVVRYVLVWPTDWQSEFTIFLLLGTTFMGAAYTQLHRGHVGIEILENLLPARINRWRDIIGASLSAVVCAVLGWQSWALFAEAWEFNYITESTWAPKLWVPYLSMALGLSLLVVQLIAQVMDDLSNGYPDGARRMPTHAEEAE